MPRLRLSAFARVLCPTGLLFGVVLFNCGPALGAPPPRAAAAPAVILSDSDLVGDNRPLTQTLAEVVRRAGYSPSAASVDQLLAPGALAPWRCRLLVLPRCRALPTALIAPVQNYLHAGGHLIALGTPLWETPLVRDESGHWVSSDLLARSRALTYPQSPVPSFPPKTAPGAWSRNSNDMAGRISTEVVTAATGRRRAPALHVRIENLTGWDTLVSPTLQRPFPKGETFTVLSARGGPRTHSLAIEWDERDGSRWIATIPLSAEWRWYALPPSAFHQWEAPRPRAHPGFYPPDAVRLSVGLAFTHTGWTDGRHEYWVAGIGTSRAPRFSDDAPMPALDSLCPDYAVFDVHGRSRLEVSSAQSIVSPEPLPQISGAIRSSQPRPGGGGFDKRRTWRWISLVNAVDGRSGAWRGAPCTLLVHGPGGDIPGGAWAAFTPDESGFYLSAPMRRVLEQTARRMRDGLFLLDGGAEFYTLFEGQAVRLGARVMALPKASGVNSAISVRVRVTTHNGRVAWKRAWPVRPVAGATVTRESRWTPPSAWPHDGYRVTAELLEQGRVVDRVEHDLHVWMPPAHPHFITARPDGHFSLDHRLWRALGVNYMPSSGIGLDDWEPFEHWLEPQAYDPEIVERDLSHIQEIGLNAVSVFIYVRDVRAQNLLDLFRRCQVHHLHVNLALRPGLPDMFVWSDIRQILDYYQLSKNDTVFAYDVAWEPGFGGQRDRRAMDTAWRKWVDAHYGGIDPAEQAWGVRAPKEGAGLTGPTDAQIISPDPRLEKLVGDYRRFLDEWLRDTYGAVRTLLKSVDPNHSVSFRMSEAGDPTNKGDGGLPYRFEGLGGAVDFLSPEGYGRIGDWTRVRPGWFETAYGRAVEPQMPIVWAEVGTSAVSGAEMTAGAPELKSQGDFYHEFLRMARLSGCDGVIFWWYPGGYRTNERSDFGLINPDGSDRPATREIRGAASAFLNASAPAAPDCWLNFKSDWRPNSVYQAYKELGESFWSAISRGHRPGLRVTPPPER